MHREAEPPHNVGAAALPTFQVLMASPKLEALHRPRVDISAREVTMHREAEPPHNVGAAALPTFQVLMASPKLEALQRP